MSDQNNLPPEMSNPPSPTTSQPSRNNLFSKGENMDDELEEDSLQSEKEESLEKKEHLKSEGALVDECLGNEEPLGSEESLGDMDLPGDEIFVGYTSSLGSETFWGLEDIFGDAEFLEHEDVLENQQFLGEEVPENQQFLGEVPENQQFLGEEVPENQQFLGEKVPENQQFLGEEVPENQQFLGEVPENQQFLGEEVPENQQFLGEVPENQQFLGEEVPENQQFLEEEVLEYKDYLEEEDGLGVQPLKSIEQPEIIDILKNEEFLMGEKPVWKKMYGGKKHRVKERKKHTKEKVENLEEEKYLEDERYQQGNKYSLSYQDREEEDELEEDIEKFIKKEFKTHSLRTTPSFLGASTSQRYMLYAKPPPQVFSPPDMEYSDMGSSLGSQHSWMTLSPFLRNQASQTIWPYKKKSGHGILETPREALESQRSFWSSLLSEPVDRKPSEQHSEKLSIFSYKSGLPIGSDISPSEMEEFTDSAINKLLDDENKLKKKKRMKKHHEYKDSVTSEPVKDEAPTVSETVIPCSYILTYKTTLEAETKLKEELEMEKMNTELQKKLELDTEWMHKMMKMHQGDGELLLYDNESIFKVLFPDGTGQIYYPSGNLAMLISCTGVAKFTYIVLEDSEDTIIQALVNNSGHATFYDRNGKIWSTLSINLGFYFLEGKRQKAWNWWNLAIHSHAPPIRPITLKLNEYIQIQIKSQDMIIFSFTYKKKCICLNLGTRYKIFCLMIISVYYCGIVGMWRCHAAFFSIHFDVLDDLKAKAVLEVEPGHVVRKIQILLGKISRILKFLTIFDLVLSNIFYVGNGESQKLWGKPQRTIYICRSNLYFGTYQNTCIENNNKKKVWELNIICSGKKFGDHA
ncbi:glutamate-rich protein 6B [Thomomys bottae]